MGFSGNNPRHGCCRAGAVSPLAWWAVVLTVKPALEDRGHTAVGQRANRHRPGASRLQSGWRVLTPQALQTQTSPITLLRVRAVFKLPGHHRSRADPDAQAPVDQLLRGPLQVGAVRGWHVLGCGGVGTALVADSMAGHALVR